MDDEAAARTWAGGIAAPPTYLSRLARIRGFSLPMPVPAWWSPLPGCLASVEVDLAAPIRPGDVLRPAAMIRDIAVQETPQGTLAGIVRDFDFTNQAGEHVGRTRRIVAKFLDAPLFDRTGLVDGLGGLRPPLNPVPADERLPAFSRAAVSAHGALLFAAAPEPRAGLYHMDPEYARSLGLGGALVIEHLKLAYLANMLEDWAWGSEGGLPARGPRFSRWTSCPRRCTTGGLAPRPAPTGLRRTLPSGSRTIAAAWELDPGTAFVERG